MGIAAYNRGSAVIIRNLNKVDGFLATKYTDLTEYSAAHDGRVGFQATVIRRDTINGEWNLMNRQEKGWAQRSYGYATLWQLFAEWRMAIIGDGRDEYGYFIAVQPIPKVVKL